MNLRVIYKSNKACKGNVVRVFGRIFSCQQNTSIIITYCIISLTIDNNV